MEQAFFILPTNYPGSYLLGRLSSQAEYAGPVNQDIMTAETAFHLSEILETHPPLKKAASGPALLGIAAAYFIWNETQAAPC